METRHSYQEPVAIRPVHSTGWQGACTTWNPNGRKWALYRDNGAPAPVNGADSRLIRDKRGAVRTFRTRLAAEAVASSLA